MDGGRLFCFGFDGLEAPDALLFALDRDRVGAVILFSRNCRDAVQIRSLTRRLREAGGEQLWILVDQEGGRVRRIIDPDIGPRPAPQLGRQAPPETERDYFETAGHLARLGIDFNLAPVADVLLHPDNPVLRDRTFGDDPETVSAHVRAAVRGTARAGLKACAKHFPGLGAAETDPHLTETIDPTAAATFRTVHWLPFAAAIEAGVSAVMTTHLLAPALDQRCIATYSAAIVHRLLEQELGFRGLVLSDDLQMKALPDPPPFSAWQAFEAGHHLLLIGQDAATQAETLLHFRSRCSGDASARARLRQALDRQERFRGPFAHAFV